ncbi:hypothetical protein L1887_10960 [Cichorium endivia]|nr:hypothetical protein L1887_10960 [Cichorium endivia]
MVKRWCADVYFHQSHSTNHIPPDFLPPLPLFTTPSLSFSLNLFIFFLCLFLLHFAATEFATSSFGRFFWCSPASSIVFRV